VTRRGVTTGITLHFFVHQAVLIPAANEGEAAVLAPVAGAHRRPHEMPRAAKPVPLTVTFIPSGPLEGSTSMVGCGVVVTGIQAKSPLLWLMVDSAPPVALLPAVMFR
jgi:hypothetical protein